MHVIKQAFLILSRTLAVKRKTGFKDHKSQGSKQELPRTPPSLQPSSASPGHERHRTALEMQQVASVACNSGCKSGAIQQTYFAVLNLF